MSLAASSKSATTSSMARRQHRARKVGSNLCRHHAETRDDINGGKGAEVWLWRILSCLRQTQQVEPLGAAQIGAGSARERPLRAAGGLSLWLSRGVPREEKGA